MAQIFWLPACQGKLNIDQENLQQFKKINWTNTGICNLLGNIY